MNRRGGTSSAAAMTSAVAALVWSEHPTWTSAQVRTHLMDTVDHLPAYVGYCVSKGRLNMALALGAGTCP